MTVIDEAFVLVLPDFDQFRGKFASEMDGEMRAGEGVASRGMGRIAKVVAVAAAAMAAAVAAAAVVGTRAAIEFENSLAEVVTLISSEPNPVLMKELELGVRQLGRDFGTLSDEAIPAVYQAISAGVPQENVFDFLEVANKAAIAGVTDLETAVDGITSVVNAFGEENVNAAQASDLMFAAVRGGKTTFEELSTSMFQVGPVAASLGIEFGDVTASLAALTSQGVPTRVATTQLRSAFAELGKEGTKASDVFKEAAGVSFQEFIAQGHNVQDAFKIMEQAADDNNLSVLDLFGSVEAGQAVLALTGEGAEKFAQELDAAANSAGATDDAFDVMSDTAEFAIGRLVAAGEQIMLSIGQALLPFVKTILDLVLPSIMRVVEALGEDGFAGAFREIGAIIREGDLLGTVGEIFSGVLDFIVNNINNIVDFILDSREAFFDAAISIFSQLAEALPTIIPRVIEAIVNMIVVIVDTLVQAAPLILTGAIMLLTGLIEGIVDSIPAVVQGIVSIVDSILTTLISALPDILDAAILLVVELIKGIVQMIPQIITTVAQIIPQLIVAVIALLPQLLVLGATLIIEIIKGIVEAIPQLLQTIREEVIPNMIDTLQNQLPQMIQQGVEFMQEFAVGMAETIGEIADVITNDVVPAITEHFENNPEVIQAGIDAIMALIQGMVDNIVMMTEFITDVLIPLMTTVLEENLPAIIDAAILIIEALIEGMIIAMPQINNAIITQIIPAMVQAWLTAMPAFTNAAFQLIIGFVRGLNDGTNRRINGWFRALPGVLRNFFSNAGNWLVASGRRIISGWRSGIIARWAAVRSWFREMPGRIRGFFTNAANWLRNAGSRIISGLISGIRDRFGDVRRTLGDLTSMLPNWKGPAERDRRILDIPAANIMSGFADALQFESRQIVQPALSDITRNLAPTTMAGDGVTATPSTDGIRMHASEEPQHIEVTLHLKAEDLLTGLRKTIRVQGGDVQGVLGTARIVRRR